jgi:hypothetical protein
MNPHTPFHIQASTALLPEVMALIQAHCMDEALPPGAGHKMQLAAEEVMIALPQGTALSIQVLNKADRITLAIICPPSVMDLSAFNLAWRPDLERDAAGLGLALASRWVDTFSLERDGSGRLHLLFSVEKIFDQPVPLAPPLKAHRFYRLIRPTPEIMAACGQRLFHHIKGINPDTKAFHPARLAALTEKGQLFGALAETESGEVAGAAFCIPEEGRLLRGYGPFVFTDKDRPRMAEDLACHCLERVGRKPFSGVLTRLFDEDCFPEKFYIPAGGHAPSGTKTAWHFPLCDDAGGLLHYTADIAAFIDTAVTRQDLPRKKILMENPLCEARGPSVFSSSLNRKEKKCRMRLLMAGEDMEANLEAHLSWLREEGLFLCDMHLDLAKREEASLLPLLSKKGFSPTLLLPGGGSLGDLLILEARMGQEGERA